jgi:maltose alpha-D-glucosyltransferase/alpha-amylase
MIARRHVFRGTGGHLIAYPGRFIRQLENGKGLSVERSQVLQTEQSNTSIIYENKLFFKLFRRLEEGVNPELEIVRFLTEKASFPNVPPFAGAIEFRKNGSEPIVIGILQAFVPNQGDAWKYTLDSLIGYFERVLSRKGEIEEPPRTPVSLMDVALQEVPLLVQELVGGVYLEMARLLGKRTGELHLALASNDEDPDFAPEPFSVLYQRSLYQSMQSLTKRVFDLLKKNLGGLSDGIKEEATSLLGAEKQIIETFKSILKRKISAMKIRIHGDYHLGQVLYTGNDFVIIDFEGEPARALSERRLKRSPLRDVAGMIRSFHYAAYVSLFRYSQEFKKLEPWAVVWYKYISGAFLRSYLDTVKDAPFIPKEKEELSTMLKAYLLEKAVYELGYELNNRPDWLVVPIRGIKSLLEG